MIEGFNRFAICEASYIFAQWLPPEQGGEIEDRLKKLKFKPSLSVHQAGLAAFYGVYEHPISHELDRSEYADTRRFLAAMLRRWRKAVLCEWCGRYVFYHTLVMAEVETNDYGSYAEVPICNDCLPKYESMPPSARGVQ